MTTWENFMVSEQWKHTSCIVYVFIIQMQQKTELGLYESKISKYSWNVSISFEVKVKGYSYQTMFLLLLEKWVLLLFIFT